MNKNKYKSMTAHVYCRRQDCVHHAEGVCTINPHITLGINDLGICQDFEVDFIDLLNDYQTSIHTASDTWCQNIEMAKEKVIKAYNDAKSR